MKQKYSILILLARQTLGRLLLVCILTGGLQFGLYIKALNQNLQYDNPYVRFSYIFGSSNFALVTILGFLLVYCFVVIGGGLHVNTYTIRRLSVSKNTELALRTVNNSMAFFIFWICQIAVFACMVIYFYSVIDNSKIGGQDLVIMIYSDNFLHRLIPMREYSAWICNVFTIIGLGTATACASIRVQIVGRKQVITIQQIILIIATITLFNMNYRSIGILILSMIATTAFAGVEFIRMRGDLDEKV